MPTTQRADGSPTVSVALCTYNGAAYLGDLLDSLIEQKHQPDELVVCDDMSTDGTVEIVEAFAQRAPFDVHIHIGHRQRGPTENFAWAIGLCTGDLIALCDQDDVWLPEKIARGVEAFRTNPAIGFSFSDAELVGTDLTHQGRTLWDAVGFKPQFREQAEAGDMLRLLIPFTFVTGATMMFRSDLRDVVLPMPHNWHHDAWIAIVSCFLRPYTLLEEPLMLYRLHGGNAVGVPERAVTNIWEMRWKQAAAPAKVDLHRQRRRVEADRLDRLAERYGSAGVAYLAAGRLEPLSSVPLILQEMQQRSEHSAIRGSLSDHRLKRWPVILKELRTGRYRRFSAGILSAIQDALY